MAKRGRPKGSKNKVKKVKMPSTKVDENIEQTAEESEADAKKDDQV